MKNGIYEQLITELVSERLASANDFYIGERRLDGHEASIWLARFLSEVLKYAFETIPVGENRVSEQIKFANDFLTWIKDKIDDPDLINENLLDSRGRILTALYRLENPIAHDLGLYASEVFPQSGLTQSELFSGSNSGLSLDGELKREIRSANQIYWLVSFIKWSGLRIFCEALKEFVENGGILKVITTSYMGATDLKAVEFLADLPNSTVKINYNRQQERLHAKSYLFLRDTDFHTGYIGSSNLSRSALTNGLEWNLKLTSQEIPHVIQKSISMFETYWESNEFEIYNSENREKLVQALANQRGPAQETDPYYYDIRPYPHQTEILEQLLVERELHNRYRNLIVAATGTGKTLISAFDFARYLNNKPNAKFLFIAHRQEILVQARSAYRGVLRDMNFGELWVGGQIPNHYRQLFASIQTLSGQLNELNLSPDFYDYIVIDEVHHIAANSYRPIVDFFKPEIFLGLTATPERHDGSSILSDFCGVIAAEIRLPEAINRRQLCPFQYFIIDDGTDLSEVGWSRGRYDVSELSNIYTNDDLRSSRIIDSLNQIVTNHSNIKALGFCVSREHAQYMTRQFIKRGIKSDYLTSDNSQERVQKRQDIRNGTINVLFVVDIFNEGVDIPEIDTLLFLRPTESLTVFLQQFGRGLRLAENKEICTILDFVGNSRPEYDFSNKFRALVGKTNTSIENEAKQDFPNPPLGCHIELTRRAKEIVLTNIRSAILNHRRLLGLIRNFPTETEDCLTLTNFLRINPQVRLIDIYRHSSWSELVSNAQDQVINGRSSNELYPVYARMIKNRLLASDAHHYFDFINNLVSNNYHISGQVSERLAVMAHYDFWQESGPNTGFTSVAESLQSLADSTLGAELKELTEILKSQTKHEQLSMPGFESIPLKLHARYASDQIKAAFGASSFERRDPSREGVLYIAEQNIELLFVTLNKDEGRFSPTTMYHDYAISEELFHWQSQNSARPDRGRGLSYINHQRDGKHIFLFVREQSRNEIRGTLGFVNLGEVEFVSSSGSRPMNIVWRLKTPLPAFMWQSAAKLAVG